MRLYTTPLFSVLFSDEHNLSQALEMLKQVYGDNAMSRTRAFEWHKRFKEGCQEVEDDSRSGRPSTSSTEVDVKPVKQTVHGDRR